MKRKPETAKVFLRYLLSTSLEQTHNFIFVAVNNTIMRTCL
jgi:hypothetical protein